MAKIHGLAYILIGLFISIFSYKVNYEKLVFFYYLGYIFIFVGILKLIFSLMKRKSSKTKELHHKEEHKHQSATMHKENINSMHRQQQYKYCNNCRNVVRITDKFCSRCGARV